MWAKKSKLGLRYFAHVSDQPRCPSTGETAEHLSLKAQLAQAVRRAGWDVELEAMPRLGDVGGWRADVLATDPTTGQRVAFEAQLASMTVDEGTERTAKYAADDIATLWVTTNSPVWLWQIPGFRVQPWSAVLEDDGYRGPVRANADSSPPVVEGVAVFREHSLKNPKGFESSVEVIQRWEKPLDFTLDGTVAAALRGELVAHYVTWLNERMPYGSKGDGDRQFFALVAKADRTAESEYTGGRGLFYVAKQRRAAIEHAAYEHRNKVERVTVTSNARPLTERQARVVRTVMGEVRGACLQGEHVWIGIPPRLFVVVDAGEHGDASSAQGMVLSIGADASTARTFCIISPVHGLINAEHAERWRAENILVFVENDYEAELVAGALSWPIEDVLVRRSVAS
jgi:hypothetical protein